MAYNDEHSQAPAETLEFYRQVFGYQKYEISGNLVRRFLVPTVEYTSGNEVREYEFPRNSEQLAITECTRERVQFLTEGELPGEFNFDSPDLYWIKLGNSAREYYRRVQQDAT